MKTYPHRRRALHSITEMLLIAVLLLILSPCILVTLGVCGSILVPSSDSYRRASQKLVGERDLFEACRQWGKGSTYVKKMTSDYRVFKDVGLVAKDEILSSSLDACIERVTNPDQLPVCHACMTEIIDSLFKE